jgi:hypothetical protein
LADIQAGKWTFCPNLLNRGSDFWNYIIVKTMLHEIHQQSYILPHMSQLNPKYFWIWLTSLENTLMLVFKHEVKIFSILFNFRKNFISHITFFDIWCRNNIILQKNYRKIKKSLSQGGVEPGTLRSEGQCVDHWATLPLHIIWQKKIWIHFSL